MKINLILISLLFILNCHHTKVRFDDDAPSIGTKTDFKIIEKSVWYWTLSTRGKFWAAGSSRLEVIDLQATCPSGVYEVDHFLTAKQVIFTQLTFGVYIPYTLKVTCN